MAAFLILMLLFVEAAVFILFDDSNLSAILIFLESSPTIKYNPSFVFLTLPLVYFDSLQNI